MHVPDYELPEAAIAQDPIEPRDAARLLVALDPGGAVAHRHVRDLPEILEPDDVVVVNTSRVLPARLHLTKSTGGAAEVLLLEPEPGVERCWVALVRPGRRLPPGTILEAGGEPWVEVGAHLEDGRRQVRLLRPEALDRVGTVPLPPYIHHPLSDPERYQTVYADRPGSVAAPTAGLHLTDEVLSGLRERGIGVRSVDLAVGLGTFRPVTAERPEDHVMHVERYSVPASTMDACREAGRVVAIGTTTVRALESAAATGELEGRSDLFIHGEYPFALVDVLMTNFHLPRSTLLLLLESFAGPRWRSLYSEALAAGYRFLSFGDAMLISRQCWEESAGSGRGESGGPGGDEGGGSGRGEGGGSGRGESG
ncbi:MAG: tRNA preQ1(34) S-adenosylmethionine ribosyltransferase-isomerase QueA, partial [Acidimicrobiaceae bacterium]|nr:tRNA preQ1(34) S-adenosylmethionine ribosyltransferase-isomerase QueA [Acidimicrobiaceae bacterium]